MKILLSGASGFTGRFFTSAAEEAGHLVVALLTDLRDDKTVTSEIVSIMPDAVVHLAGVSFVGHKDEVDFYEVNVVGTTNLLNGLASLPVKPRTVLVASSANVYGNCEESLISENQIPIPINHYAMSKLAMEYMARSYLDKLPILFSRTFNYTGPGQNSNFLVPKIVKHFSNHEKSIELGNLNVEREFNDVRMVCNAYLKLLESGIPGEVYNVCSGKAYNLHYVIGLLSRITGHSIDIQVSSKFIRKNEVQRLCGNPKKLQACTGALEEYDFQNTLEEMLEFNRKVLPRLNRKI